MLQNLLNKIIFFSKLKLRTVLMIFFSILLIQFSTSIQVQARSFDIENINNENRLIHNNKFFCWGSANS